MQGKLDIRKVLVPVDFSDTSRKAFYVGVRFARFFDAETHILHINEPIASFDSSYDRVEAVSEELARLETGVKRRINELFEHGGIAEVDRRKVKVHIGGGKPHAKIVHFAIEEGIDMIVMGTHGNAGLKTILVGSTTERVVRTAPCPVLCIKPDGYVSPLQEKDYKKV